MMISWLLMWRWRYISIILFSLTNLKTFLDSQKQQPKHIFWTKTRDDHRVLIFERNRQFNLNRKYTFSLNSSVILNKASFLTCFLSSSILPKISARWAEREESSNIYCFVDIGVTISSRLLTSVKLNSVMSCWCSSRRSSDPEESK